MRRALWVLPLIWAGCASSPRPVSPSDSLADPGRESPSEAEQIVTARTVLPDAAQGFAIPETKTGRAQLLVPSQLLALATISRPTAHLREGPGAHFPIADRLLTRGDFVVIFDLVDPWARVAVPGLDLSGWVHRATLTTAQAAALGARYASIGAIRPASRAGSDAPLVALRVKSLPAVFTVRHVHKVYAYRTRDPLEVTIPKGTRMLRLNRSGRRTLVWIPTTDSVMWLRSRDIDS